MFLSHLLEENTFDMTVHYEGDRLTDYRLELL